MDKSDGEFKKKKKSTKYHYEFGDFYPGNKYGHKWCLAEACGLSVPTNMGWLWNSKNVPGLKFRRGWRPGAIGKTVQKLMKFKVPYQAAPVRPRGRSRARSGGKKGRQGGKRSGSGGPAGATGGGGGGGGGGRGPSAGPVAGPVGYREQGGHGRGPSAQKSNAPGGGGTTGPGGASGGQGGGGGQGTGPGGAAGGGKTGGGGQSKAGGDGVGAGGATGAAGGGQTGIGTQKVSSGGKPGGGFEQQTNAPGIEKPGPQYAPEIGEMAYYDYDPEDLLEPKPTLKIHRKGDVYTIQVNPLKDLTDLQDHEDPYVDCEPMVFKIIKKRDPEEQAKVDAKRLERERKRRDQEIRNALKDAADDICKCVYMDVYCNDLTALDRDVEKCPAIDEPECTCRSESMSSVSSNASWDIEYTPPFGCFDLRPRRRLEVTHTETQYSLADAGVERTRVCTSKKKKSKCCFKKMRCESR